MKLNDLVQHISHTGASETDITAGYRSVELMKQYVARTMNEHCIGGLGGFGAGMLADYLINNSLLPFLVTCLAAFLLTAFCQMFRLWIFHGASFWRLLAVALGQSVFSLPLAVPYYYISRAFHRRRALR